MKKQVGKLFGYYTKLPVGIIKNQYPGELSELSQKKCPGSPYSSVSPILTNIIDDMIYGNLATAETKSGKWVCEYRSQYNGIDSADLIYFNPGELTKDGNIIMVGGTYQADGSIGEFDMDKRIGTAILGALIPAFMKNPEFKRRYKEFYKTRKAYLKLEGITSIKPPKVVASNMLDAQNKNLALLCDNAYRQLVAGVISVGTEIGCSQLFNKDGIFQDFVKVEFGEGEFTKLNNKTELAVVIDNHGHVYSDEEKALIPNVPGFIPSEEVKMTLLAVASSKFRNVIFEGEAGTGKSVAAQWLAQEMGRPYVVHSTMRGDEGLSLLGQYVPISEKSLLKELPSDEEMAYNDAPYLYQKLTGVEIDSVSRVEVQRLYREAITARAGGFEFIESEIVRAAKYGYVVEIQEANLADIMASINALTDMDQGVARLDNGETVICHKNFVIVVTMNQGYSGTEELNKSVANRFGIKWHFADLNQDEMVERALTKGTESLNAATIEKMAGIVIALNDYQMVNGYEDQLISMRPLNDWIKMADVLNGDIVNAAKCTILTACSIDPKITTELWTNVIEGRI